jgi:hypothetical protein
MKEYLQYPERGLGSVRGRSPKLIAPTVVLVILACQGENATAPVRMQSPENPSFTVYDAPTRTMGVSISAGGRFYTDTYRSATVSITGGNGTNYIEWYEQTCFGTWCDEQYLHDAGWGLTSTSFHLTTNISWIKIIAHVFDNPDLPFSGSATVTLIGPEPHSYSGALKCQIGDEHYPIHDWDPAHQTYEGYYRDGCTGQRVYDPAHPHVP